jgi:hypothetical protein
VLAQAVAAPMHHGAIVGHGEFRYRVDKLWCQADKAKHPVKDCHEMVQAGDGRLYLITNHKQNNVLVFDTAGKVVDAWSVGMGAGHGLSLERGADGKE